MKILKFLSIMAMTFALVTTGITGEVHKAKAQQFQTADSFVMRGLDTLSTAVTDTATKNIKGKKAVVTLSVDIKKISGTIGGSIKYWRAIGGGWALIETDTITDASYTYDCVIAPGSGLSYMVTVTESSGTFSHIIRGMYN